MVSVIHTVLQAFTYFPNKQRFNKQSSSSQTEPSERTDTLVSLRAPFIYKRLTLTGQVTAVRTHRIATLKNCECNDDDTLWGT